MEILAVEVKALWYWRFGGALRTFFRTCKMIRIANDQIRSAV